jgi:hypothetical protein
MNVKRMGRMWTKSGLAAIVLIAYAAVPGTGAEKANFFNPFTRQRADVLSATNSSGIEVQPSVILSDWLGMDVRLKQAPVRPTTVLRSFKIRIPVRPALRSPWRVGIVRW